MTVNPRFPKYRFLLPLLLLFGSILLTVSGKTAASPQGGYLTAVQITDHALTGEDISYIGGYLNAAIGRNSAHVLWREQNTTNTGTDLFYRSLPNGTTQRLSDITNANNAGVFFPILNVSETDTPHVVWEEYNNTVDARDLNYWNPSDGAISLVDQTPTAGFATFRPVTWLEGDDFHVVWQQFNTAQTENIYMYWNSVSKTAVELPGFKAGLVHNGVLHITWEGSINGPVNYWNSNDQVTVSLPNSATVGDASVFQRGIFANTAGQITIFFGFNSLGDAATTCLASWNTNTQITAVHVTTSKCFSGYQVQQDSQGVYHTFGGENTSGFLPYYWNSDLSNAIFFDVSGVGTGFGIPGGTLYVSNGGNAHILWEDDKDLYYWNPDDQQIVNLSAASGTNTNIASYSKFRGFDAAGNLLVVWQEQTSSGSPMVPFYWQSAHQITTNLLTKLGLSSIEEQALANPKGPNPVFMYYGTPTVGDAGAFYWDIIADSVTPVWTGPNNNTFFQYADEPGDDVLTAWIDQADYSLVLTSAQNGNQVMNQTAADDTGNLVAIIGFDDFGNVYAIWTEMSDSSGEGVDFFAAWSTDFVEGSANLYLPFVTR